jgi:hypothetical protein
MDLQELLLAFKDQLDEAVPSTGDYLNGMTSDTWLAHETARFNNVEKAQSFLAKQIKRWADHKGERMVFYIKRSPDKISLCSAWESEFPGLAATHKLVSNSKPVPELEAL